MLLHFPDGSQGVGSIEPVLQETLQYFEGACKTRQRYERFKATAYLLYCLGPFITRIGFHLLAFIVMGLIQACIAKYLFEVDSGYSLILIVSSFLMYSDIYRKLRKRKAAQFKKLSEIEINGKGIYPCQSSITFSGNTGCCYTSRKIYSLYRKQDDKVF